MKKQMEYIVDIISKNSRALLGHISRHPDELQIILDYGTKDPRRAIEDLENKLHEQMDHAIETGDYDCSKEVLRIFKYNLLCIISAGYLTQEIDTKRFLALWSEVARICAENTYHLAYSLTASEYGQPLAMGESGGPTDFKFTVIALGKLGAGELNLSSDIDVMFLYNTDKGGTTGGRTLNEFASRLARTFVSILSARDYNGFCFRVDTDLRPEGRKGAIANSIDAALEFYETWGDELDRMMLIRAAPVAGDKELGQEFISRIKPFVYRKTLDRGALEKIKEAKVKIRREAAKSLKKGINIKLGGGGIREIEFIVHAIQLLHGGRDERLVTTSTLDSLNVIREGNYLTSRQTDELEGAYLFLRHMENMLQIEDEEQTHSVPSSAVERQALAAKMGYRDYEQLLADLDKHTGMVKLNFKHMFETDLERQEMEEAILTNLATCKNIEEEIDSLAWFKREETKKIQFQDLQKETPPDQVSNLLSLIAEVIVSEAYKVASDHLRNAYGPPLAGDAPEPASLSIIGMGKLGGREIDYASDLDLMFIYSEDGMTAGPRKITNQEYFSKLLQRIISLITMPTRYGMAYQIDVDLRPSGRAGVLVSSLTSFRNYHHIEAMTWERQALLKARHIAGDPSFGETVTKVINEICYDMPLQANIQEQIVELRNRMKLEKAKESETRLNLKLGEGGLMDIETIVQYLQLKNGHANEGLRTGNTLELIKLLTAQQLISGDGADTILNGYQFLKRVLSRTRLFSNHTTDHLDKNSEHLSMVAKSLSFKNRDELIEEINRTREAIRKVYNHYFAG